MSMGDIAKSTAKQWRYTPAQTEFAAELRKLMDRFVGSIGKEGLGQVLECEYAKLPGKDDQADVATSDEPILVDARQPFSAPAENSGGDESRHVHQDEVIDVSPASEAEQTSPSRAGEDETSRVREDEPGTVPPARGPDSPMPDRGEQANAIDDGEWVRASVGRQMPSEGDAARATDSGEDNSASARQPVAGGDERRSVPEDEPVSVPSRSPAAPGVPFMITHGMRNQLRHRGFSDEQIRQMRPEDAVKILLPDTSAPGLQSQRPAAKTPAQPQKPPVKVIPVTSPSRNTRPHSPPRRGVPKPSPALQAKEAHQKAAMAAVNAALLEWQQERRWDGKLWMRTAYFELDHLDHDGALSREIKRVVTRPLDESDVLENLMTWAQYKECKNAASRSNMY